MIEIVYIIMMLCTLRLFERVTQVFNSSSIQSHAKVISQQQVVAQFNTNKCFSRMLGMPGNRCNSLTNYGGKSELFPYGRDLAHRDGHGAG